MAEKASRKLYVPGVWRGLLVALLAGIGCALSSVAYAQFQGCEEDVYFAPGDVDGLHPLSTPDSAFSKTHKAAMRGSALEQRNLAVSYESGYLVSRCFEIAAYWYQRAAKGGDEVAKKWVEHDNPLAKLRALPECSESACNLDSADMPQFLSLIADSRGHFHSSLTINGVTVVGVIDTGASTVAMSVATANLMRIPLAGSTLGRSQTANGNVGTLNKVVPSIRVGNSIILDNVEIAILPNTPTLIGMSVLRRLKVSAAGGQMVLSR
ncbi:MAG: TIGR02281 family clan AA aspartic protease [Sulfuritalea sp.]|nr:TIGR02281 family clan AA aspartic protease [Sulfuritalea sp.]